jgi:hypothetical protein
MEFDQIKKMRFMNDAFHMKHTRKQMEKARDFCAHVQFGAFPLF